MSKQITNIVFTKNRPLQLDAYLESLYRYFLAERIQTHIIYKPELFGEEYESLFKKYPDCIVIRENDFHTDCMKIINQADTKYILFGIDDVVFFDSVDFDLIDEIFRQKDDIFGFSLRFGQNILSGPDEAEEFKISDQSFYRLDWTKGRTPTTRYPFELCATVYRTELIKRILKNSRTNSPIAERLFAPNSELVKTLGAIFKKHKFLTKPTNINLWPSGIAKNILCANSCISHSADLSVLKDKKFCNALIFIVETNEVL